MLEPVGTTKVRIDSQGNWRVSIKDALVVANLNDPAVIWVNKERKFWVVALAGVAFDPEQVKPRDLE